MHHGAARVLDTRANLQSQLIIERDCAHHWHAPFLKRILTTNRS